MSTSQEMYRGKRLHYVHRDDSFFDGHHKVSSGNLQTIMDNGDGTKSYGIQNERGKIVYAHQDKVHDNYKDANDQANELTHKHMQTEAIAQGDWHVIDDESNEIHSTHPTYRKAMNKMNKLNQDPATEHKGTANRYSISSADYYEKTKGNLSRQVKQKVSEQENQEMTQGMQVDEAKKFDDGEVVGKSCKKQKPDFAKLRQQKRQAIEKFAEAILSDDIPAAKSLIESIIAANVSEQLEEMKEDVSLTFIGEGKKEVLVSAVKKSVESIDEAKLVQGDEHDKPWDKMTDGARELSLHAENDSTLYHNSYQPCVENLKKKIKSGKYDRTQVPQLAKYHADRAADSYAKQHGSRGQKGTDMFSPTDRKQAAHYFAQTMHSDAHEG